MSHATGSPIVYLAGPEVFLRNAREIGDEKQRICELHGLKGLFPLYEEALSATSAVDRGHSIFRKCVESMETAQLIVANMTPFRGPSMDVGTAVEVGFMYARGYPVFGYTNVVGDYADRVTGDNMNVERFGFPDNLMCEGTVYESGGFIVRTNVARDELYTDLQGFEECVRQAASVVLANPGEPTGSAAMKGSSALGDR